MIDEVSIFLKPSHFFIILELTYSFSYVCPEVLPYFVS
jgi:hypothetical protein